MSGGHPPAGGATRFRRNERAANERELIAKAERLLMALSTRFLVSYGYVERQRKPVEPISMTVNMIYDPRPHNRDGDQNQGKSK